MVVMYKCLGYHYGVVSRAKHNPRVLELAFANRLVAVGVENRQNSCNFGHFGPCRTYNKNLTRLNLKPKMRALALSFSVFVMKRTHSGENRVQKFQFSAEKCGKTH